MKTKEMIEWLETNIRTSFLPQIWGETDDSILRAIVKILQDHDKLKEEENRGKQKVIMSTNGGDKNEKRN